MKVVIQRCKKSHVEVNGEIVGQISNGMNLLVCLEKEDTESTVNMAVTKIGKLRIFEDLETGKMNQDISQAGGAFLAISQFTLSWDGRKGNRPSFDLSMGPEQANNLFQIFCEKLSAYAEVQQGVFAADMQVHIQNDGPVTFVLNF